jgi:spermidine synthase
MDLWITETHEGVLRCGLKVEKTLFRDRSQYQEILIVQTNAFGRVLLLDGVFQTTEGDEFFYHEMIIHVPLCAHPDPKRILIIGGGDGGCVREALKHQSLEKIVHVEIDEKVVEACLTWLPLHNPDPKNANVELHIDDGIKFLKDTKEKFDIVIVDSTDPVGPAVGLFEYDFFKSIYDALTDDGIMAAQSASPFMQKRIIRNVHDSLNKIFPIVKLYLSPMPTYPTGLWSYTIASKRFDPVKPARNLEAQTKHYNVDIHQSSFVLPNFVRDIFN